MDSGIIDNSMRVAQPGTETASRRQGQRGAVLVYTVLSVLVLILAVGLGADLSHLYVVKTECQNAADAAALAGAVALRLPEGQRVSGAVARAVEVLNQNKYNFDNKNFLASAKDCAAVNWTPQDIRIEFAINLDGPYVCEGLVGTDPGDAFTDRDVRFVSVTTPRVPVNIFFAASVLGSVRSLGATAKAGLAVVNSHCVVSLRPDYEKTLYVHSDSTLTASQCAIQVNSGDCAGLYVSSGYSSVTAAEIDVVGCNWHESGNSHPIVDPDPHVGEAVLADPFAYLNTPPFSAGPCNYNSLVEIKSDSPSKTLNPGVYCGGIKIGSNVPMATFNPGLYVINGFGLEISSDTNVQGQGVTFVNTAGHNGGDPSKYTPIKITSNSNANLSAPTKDYNPGNVPSKFLDILFYQDPNCGPLCQDTSLKNIVQINNTNLGPGAALTLKGALYFPTQILAVESQSNLIVDGQVVAREIKVESNSHLNVRMGSAGSLTVVPIVLYK